MTRKETNTQLIVMLTRNDYTVKNAHQVFEQCRDSKAKFWGLKEKGLPINLMKNLYAYMKECGKMTVLEAVTYTEAESMAGAKMAVECGCDYLMGTMFFDSVNDYCKRNDLNYMPFVGKVSGRPSLLEGSMDEMLAEADRYLKKGVFGFDLLGYRYAGDAVTLHQEFVKKVSAPTCLAGGIDSYQKLDEVTKCAPWAFTIGGAFFSYKFGGTLKEQIDNVCEYIGVPDVESVLSS